MDKVYKKQLYFSLSYDCMAFRFGGVKFPPMIYFKVFLCNKNGEGVKYITGRRMIRAYPLVSAFPKLITCYIDDDDDDDDDAQVLGRAVSPSQTGGS